MYGVPSVVLYLKYLNVLYIMNSAVQIHKATSETRDQVSDVNTAFFVYHLIYTHLSLYSLASSLQDAL